MRMHKGPDVRSSWRGFRMHQKTSRELAADATALCHVSAKKLVGETQYWKVPHIQVERAGPYSDLRSRYIGTLGPFV